MANNFENPELFLEVARTAAKRYPFERSEAKLLAFSENATYLIYDPQAVPATTPSRNTRARSTGCVRSTTIRR